MPLHCTMVLEILCTSALSNIIRRLTDSKKVSYGPRRDSLSLDGSGGVFRTGMIEYFGTRLNLTA
jgi:hypothetical protein